MKVPPNWFYGSLTPQIADHIGPTAAALWVRSRFWYFCGWALAVPLGLTFALWAESSGSPLVLWLAAVASWTGASALWVASVVTGHAGDTAASAYVSAALGFRARVSCPLYLWQFRWKRTLARVESEHREHLRLAQEIGVGPAVNKIVGEKQLSQGLGCFALGLIGFLIGFVVGVLIAFAIGQTESLGVSMVVIGAGACALALPLAFQPRFTAALKRYRSEIIEELSQAGYFPPP
jgi:hypothetical protein